jgi:hypothetical protein
MAKKHRTQDPFRGAREAGLGTIPVQVPPYVRSVSDPKWEKGRGGLEKGGGGDVGTSINNESSEV